MAHDAVQHREGGLHGEQQVDEHVAEVLFFGAAHVPLGLLQAGDAAEKVLCGRRKAGHHVGLALGQVDDNVRRQHRLQQGEAALCALGFGGLAAGGAGVKLHALLSADGGDAAGLPGGFHKAGGVGPAGGIGHGDVGRGHAPALCGADDRLHHRRVGGHRLFGGGTGEEVGFQQHLFARGQQDGSGQLPKEPFHRVVHRALGIAWRGGKEHPFIHGRPVPPRSARCGPGPR